MFKICRDIMKYFSLLIFVFLSLTACRTFRPSNAPERWTDDIDSALKKSILENKLLLINFSDYESNLYNHMVESIYSDFTVQERLNHYVTLFVDRGGPYFSSANILINSRRHDTHYLVSPFHPEKTILRSWNIFLGDDAQDMLSEIKKHNLFLLVENNPQPPSLIAKIRILEKKYQKLIKGKQSDPRWYYGQITTPTLLILKLLQQAYLVNDFRMTKEEQNRISQDLEIINAVFRTIDRSEDYSKMSEAKMIRVMKKNKKSLEKVIQKYPNSDKTLIAQYVLNMTEEWLETIEVKIIIERAAKVALKIININI